MVNKEIKEIIKPNRLQNRLQKAIKEKDYEELKKISKELGSEVCVNRKTLIDNAHVSWDEDKNIYCVATLGVKIPKESLEEQLKAHGKDINNLDEETKKNLEKSVVEYYLARMYGNFR